MEIEQEWRRASWEALVIYNAGKKCDIANIKGMVSDKERRLDFSSMMQIELIKLPNG